MKLFPVLLLAASGIGLAEHPSHLLKDDATDSGTEIPLGIEAVTGIRSGYVHRGFDLAGTLLDFQLEGEVTLKDNLHFNFGGWFATEVSDDFTEGAGFLDLRNDLSERFTL
ncbi:MAG: hypothetical protein GWO24_09165, partial [Akkermansiaceae bacterium]|nr:hypothetical protein [Akkermansiaceae bacterium]